MDDEVAKGVDAIKLVSLRVVSGSEGPQSADLELEIEGEIHAVQSTGDGPVDATFNAIKALFEHDAVLQLYQVHAVTEGTDAQAEVSVRLEENGKTVTGRGADTDTMVASARAYVSALNSEYGYRYGGKSHKSAEVVNQLQEPKNLPRLGLTPHAQAMPDELKRQDAILAYRDFYMLDKAVFASWKHRDRPNWWDDSIADYERRISGR